MIILGMLIGYIGLDTNTAVARFTFGISHLRSGIDMVPLVMGWFGVVTVILFNTSLANTEFKDKITLCSMRPSADDIKRSLGPTARGSVAGSALAILRGTGTTMASFDAYGLEKYLKKVIRRSDKRGERNRGT